MSTMVPMYGFGGGGGTGAALTVTAPAGCTVTVSKDGKTKTKVAGTDGVAVFRGLATGQWTVTITDGEQTAQKTVTVTADYSTAITFFSATIHVTYPAGSVCKAILNPEYGTIINNAGTVLGTVNGRTYTKKNDGEAIYAFAYAGNYTGPCVVSTNADAVFYLFHDGQVSGASGSVQYNGKTYYYTSGAWFSGNLLPSGKPCITADSIEDAALMLAKSYEDFLGVTLTAPDTSGTWDCVVPNAGTWTFGYNGHAIDSVEITESGETSLALPLYLYKSGEGPVIPMHSDGKASVQISIGTDRIGITYTVTRTAMSCVRNENAVDISKYNTLCARVNCTSNRLEPEYKGRLFVSERALVADDLSSGSLGLTLLAENHTATVYSVDVSTITDKMVYFGVHGAWMGDIYDIWLE